jgi:hypothetical protein
MSLVFERRPSIQSLVQTTHVQKICSSWRRHVMIGPNSPDHIGRAQTRITSRPNSCQGYHRSRAGYPGSDQWGRNAVFSFPFDIKLYLAFFFLWRLQTDKLLKLTVHEIAIGKGYMATINTAFTLFVVYQNKWYVTQCLSDFIPLPW